MFPMINHCPNMISYRNHHSIIPMRLRKKNLNAPLDRSLRSILSTTLPPFLPLSSPNPTLSLATRTPSFPKAKAQLLRPPLLYLLPGNREHLDRELHVQFLAFLVAHAECDGVAGAGERVRGGARGLGGVDVELGLDDVALGEC